MLAFFLKAIFNLHFTPKTDSNGQILITTGNS